MAVFGVILKVHAVDGTIVFVITLAIIILLDTIVNRLQKIAKRHGFKAIYDKLKQELMILGVRSFSVFIFEQSSTHESTRSSYFLGFEMVHIMILFMAIAFIIQAVILVQYATVGGKNLLIALRLTCDELIQSYDNLKLTTINNFLFHYFPNFIPIYPSLRTNIEYRIIERYFLKRHKLPYGFKFSRYATSLFKSYIAELGDIDYISWLTIMLLVVLNYIRIIIFDPILKPIFCQNKHYINTDQYNLHYLQSGCLNYVLGYSLTIVYALLITTFIIYIMSCYYYDKLITLCITSDIPQYQNIYKNQNDNKNNNNDFRSLYRNELIKMKKVDKIVADTKSLDKAIKDMSLLSAKRPIDKPLKSSFQTSMSFKQMTSFDKHQNVNTNTHTLTQKHSTVELPLPKGIIVPRNRPASRSYLRSNPDSPKSQTQSLRTHFDHDLL